MFCAILRVIAPKEEAVAIPRFREIGRFAVTYIDSLNFVLQEEVQGTGH
jgi:hypothetical protein